MTTVKADGQFQGYHIEVLSEMSSQEKKCLCISCLFLGGVTYFFLAKPTLRHLQMYALS